jgi:hypothetical protein
MSLAAIAVKSAYSINCFINTSTPGTPRSDGTFDFSGFLYTIMDSTGAWTPNPDVTGSGDGVKVKIPKSLNGQPFYFTIADYGNNAAVLLTSVTVTWNSGPWLFNSGGTGTPLTYTNVGLAGSSVAQSVNNPGGPAIFWFSPIPTAYVNGVNRYSGQTMSFTVQVTVSVPNSTPTPTILTFRSDPEMEVDPGK